MGTKKGAQWGLHACFRDREFEPKRPISERLWGA